MDITPHGVGEGIVFWSAVAVAGGVLFEAVRRVLRRLWRFWRWANHEVRDEIDRRRKIDTLLQKELTHNGGSSMKDAMAEIRREVQRSNAQLNDVRATQQATTSALDYLARAKGEEHDDLWDALKSLGVDRRRRRDDLQP